MPKFLISQLEVVSNKYSVEADTKTDALIELRYGNGDFVGPDKIESESCDERGMSFEEFGDDELDFDRIRSEFNADRNNDYIESVYSIEEESE